MILIVVAIALISMGIGVVMLAYGYPNPELRFRSPTHQCFYISVCLLMALDVIGLLIIIFR
jgi:hypothetical protein